MGVAALATIYRRDKGLARVAGTFVRVTARSGLIGLRDWLVVASQPPPLETDGPAPERPRLPYADWLARYDQLAETELAAALRHLESLHLPEILVLAVVTPRTIPWLQRMAASWHGSLHDGWRAALIPSPDLSPSDTRALHAAAGPRIGVVSTGTELAHLRAQHPYTLVCVGAVLLDPLSLYMFAEAAVRIGAGLVYSDHDSIDEAGTRSEPCFKPQFSPEYLARFNYVDCCFMLSRDVPLPNVDLLLRFDPLAFDRMVARLAQGTAVEHLPFLLFHLAERQPHAVHDLPAIPEDGPTVAIVIPTRDGVAHLAPCIDSIVARTAYASDKVEIIVVDNSSVDPATLAYLVEFAARPRCTVVPYPKAFNFSEVNNNGARATVADILVFINDDTVVHDPAWLSQLVWYARQSSIGVVGGRLLYPDGTIQHGGCAAGVGRGTVQHLLTRVPAADVASIDHTREMTTMTGACIAIRRGLFWEVGGFDPILRVTWNDVKLCLECLSRGFRNIYIGSSLLIHDESKTRGQDVTREHYDRYFREADYTRMNFRDYFHDDPSYSPNLSSVAAGHLAEPPRARRPWHGVADAPRILLLSVEYRIGFGVAVVIREHAARLRQLGYRVVLGGPERGGEFEFPGCERVVLESVEAAADYAFNTDVSLVICHTPPFFSLPLLIGAFPPVLSYDYGEPAAEYFPEPVRSYLLGVRDQKREAAALTTTLAAISQAVKNETANKDALVLGLANSHMPAWSESLRPQRDGVRHEHGWEEAFVVLTVCRFHVNERAYKGLDKLAAISREMPFLYPQEARPLVWVLAGGGTAEDVEEAERLGFTVFANPSDAALIGLYHAADAYMGMSRWEGYNLGISQALAMGLPTLGSDIPAHREFPITTTNSVLAVCAWLAHEVEQRTAAKPGRQPVVYRWERSTDALIEVVQSMLRRSAVPKPRLGASLHLVDEAASNHAGSLDA